MKKMLLISLLVLVLGSCSNSTSKVETKKKKPVVETKKKKLIKETTSSSVIPIISTSPMESSNLDVSSEASLPMAEPVIEEVIVEITAESLMINYPGWSLESGLSLYEYNEARKAEANRRLGENGLPPDDEFINRNPVIITREDEKAIRKNAGHMDYQPMEANTVISGVMLVE